jgi:hypothetical protein
MELIADCHGQNLGIPVHHGEVGTIVESFHQGPGLPAVHDQESPFAFRLPGSLHEQCHPFGAMAIKSGYGLRRSPSARKALWAASRSGWIGARFEAEYANVSSRLVVTMSESARTWTIVGLPGANGSVAVVMPVRRSTRITSPAAEAALGATARQKTVSST